MPYKDYDKQLAANREHYERNREVIRFAKNQPCDDCGEDYPAVCMDFDHRDPEKKVAGVGAMVNWGVKKLVAEILKCDVVCANCHRLRTWSIA